MIFQIKVQSEMDIETNSVWRHIQKVIHYRDIYQDNKVIEDI